MASDDMRRIEEDGDLRVFISSIQSLDNGNLRFQFYLPLLGQCEKVTIVCEKTGRSGEYTISYKGDNKVLLSETDYDLYVTFYLHNVSNGTETRVLALYGRVPELSSSFQKRFLKICKKYGLGPENIINLSNQDACFAGKR
ncbi:epididymal-specific lipocalin-9 [Pteropus medius]|uniref:epididymal-specific lipocalin-9 n=1 Tax=Pteropus vampyrus TaxID=132908 RepID=UPI00196BB0BF|nr:epididymal-specific lipocalin-9 [Pteropus giganteus]XP_039711139.1 epididymal-specific lipocalin-9 [Pteropus giganteus]XP_039711140.1 epididymal-specific lipocalin-9 [Pteropus giganteus]